MLTHRDINPQAPVHFLVIPKNRDGLTQLSKSSERHEPLLGHLLHVASKVALQGSHACASPCLVVLWVKCNIQQHCSFLTSACLYTAEGCDQGFRTVINDGAQGCKSAAAAPNKLSFVLLCLALCCALPAWRAMQFELVLHRNLRLLLRSVMFMHCELQSVKVVLRPAVRCRSVSISPACACLWWQAARVASLLVC